MFVRGKRKDPANDKDKQRLQGREPQTPARAASVPYLPLIPGYDANVSPAQRQQAPPPIPPYPPQTALSSAPLSLQVRPGVQASNQWTTDLDRHAWPEGQNGSTSNLHEDFGHGRSPTGRLPNLICSKFDSVLSSIDEETFSGNEKELDIYEPSHLRGGWGSSAAREASKGADRAITKVIVRSNVFAKANLYANSRLPASLPNLRLYLPSYPLICLAAQYSQRVYTKATGKEREAFVDSNWRMGTKAMVLKSVPIDDMNTIVFAIRGSQTFMDWAVNLKTAPVSPQGFLNDPGNLCHAGFLHVARRMVPSVAARLRSLLEEDPSRSSSSLLLTGHSAGGAVATLLYAHMLCEDLRSELIILTGCFKRIHCITFGTPPISLLPLQKPSEPRLKKSLFLSFINEGDPVPRADKAYIRSLLDLYASPKPPMPPPPPATFTANKTSGKPLIPTQRPLFFNNKRRGSAPAALPTIATTSATTPKPPRHYQTSAWIWHVPPSTLSNAGRLVILRTGGNSESVKQDDENNNDDVRASVASDEALRGVVFGDPLKHMMTLYARRVEVLATKAVVAAEAEAWG